MRRSRGQAKRSSLIAAVVALSGLIAGPLAAHADAIDGEWCREGRNFKIEGPKIRTYGGTEMTGDYDRHGFRYTAPASDPDAGAQVSMVLQGDEVLFLTRSPPGATSSPVPERWNRCRVTS